MIKVWSLIYRLTGWYSPAARLMEYEYIKTRFTYIQDKLLLPDNDMTLDDWMGLEIGLWQAKHRFYRKWKR